MNRADCLLPSHIQKVAKARNEYCLETFIFDNGLNAGILSCHIAGIIEGLTNYNNKKRQCKLNQGIPLNLPLLTLAL